MSRIVYKDINSTNISDITNDDAIKQSVINIVSTQRGTIPGKPEFGSSLRKYLFEPLTPFTRVTLEDNLRGSIYQFETRVKDVVITSSQSGEYGVNITISYVNKYDNSPQVVTLALQG